MSDLMGRLEILRQDVGQDSSWSQLINEPDFTCHTKKLEDGSSLIRGSTTVDLPAKYAFHMNITHEDRSEWYAEIPKSELLKEFGEQDHLVRWHLKMGWAMTYIMGLPD